VQISIKSDIDRMARVLKAFNEKAIPKATVQAINKTVAGVKSDTVKELSKSTNIQQKLVREDLRITKANKNKQYATIDAKRGRAKNLINFVSKATRKPGVYNKRLKSGKYKSKGVKAKAWGNTKVYDGSFIGTFKNGATLVFARTSSNRKPIKALRGPSLRTEFNKDENQRRMIASTRKRFEVEMRRSTNNEIRKALRVK
jgi:hypothetical protein